MRLSLFAGPIEGKRICCDMATISRRAYDLPERKQRARRRGTQGERRDAVRLEMVLRETEIETIGTLLCVTVAFFAG